MHDGPHGLAVSKVFATQHDSEAPHEERVAGILDAPRGFFVICSCRRDEKSIQVGSIAVHSISQALPNCAGFSRF